MLKLDYIPFSPSPHKHPRKNGQKPTWIVLHTMSGTFTGSQSWFKNPKSKVSAHYLVSKQGDIVCMVKEGPFAAWHVVNFNSPSIGIEMEDMDLKTKKFAKDNPNWYTPAQLDKVAELTATLMKKYLIPINQVIGHNDPKLRALGNDHIDPQHFPWEKFRELVKKHLEPNKNEQTK